MFGVVGRGLKAVVIGVGRLACGAGNKRTRNLAILRLIEPTLPLARKARRSDPRFRGLSPCLAPAGDGQPGYLPDLSRPNHRMAEGRISH
jgi:hypothetical protein